MSRSRLDQSQWVIHFIHDYDPEKDPNYVYRREEVDLWKPYVDNEEAYARFAPWEEYDRHNGLERGAAAIDVLLKILDDGHIRSGWAYREGPPTIWGPHSACCFTEMPLYSLLEYADRRRRGDMLLREYGIALLREELHRAKGRQVIYGLSVPEKEEPGPGWPRHLRAECGLARHEEYRYVPTRMGNHPGRSDWTHEREWRWADLQNRCTVPGLPIWLADEPYQFLQVRLIAETNDDAHRVMEKLKQLFDAATHERGYRLNRATLANTGVISLEQIAHVMGEKALGTIRIDDIRVEYCRGFRVPDVPAAFAQYVRETVAAASAAAREAAAAYRAELSRWPSGFSPLGGRYVILINGAQSPFLQATLNDRLAHARGGYGYELHAALEQVCETDHLQESSVAANAAKEVIEQRIPEARLWISGELED
jgi:hypothetical protein